MALTGRTTSQNCVSIFSRSDHMTNSGERGRGGRATGGGARYAESAILGFLGDCRHSLREGGREQGGRAAYVVAGHYGRYHVGGVHKYRDGKKGMYILLSNSCLVLPAVVKQQQEEISRNHVPSLFAGSVHYE